MQPQSRQFQENASRALTDKSLQRALAKLSRGFPVKRAQARDRLPEFDALRDRAREIRNHTLEHLDFYLQRFERQVVAQGGHVHWARDAAEACELVLGICRAAGARTVTKGKSMVSEEIALNEHLQRHGIEPVETDLGEYIIQLRGEHPSHIIAPAIHLNLDQVADTFHAHHRALGYPQRQSEPGALMNEARQVLRERFVAADVGITGANFCVAETGSTVIVTNEGNGDLTQILPPVHVVVTGIEKMVPTLEDTSTLLRLLSRSATGQESAVYNTFSTGPRRTDDPDGPEEFHVVLVDNGRSAMLGTGFQDMLRCIRCSACLNHCPVYAAVGGHAYGWVYSGPMGAVLTPRILGLEVAGNLADASTLCGRCEAVCPVRIPLPAMLRRLREQRFEQELVSAVARRGMKWWAALVTRPRLYHQVTALAAAMLRLAGARRGRVSRWPLASGWTSDRDLPVPTGPTFRQQWRRRRDQ